MAFDRPSDGGIDYAPCRYGTSKLLFRGPRRDVSGDYVAFLGSTETYGKFIDTPFPERVAEATGLPTVNLGCINAGVDTFHDDSTVIDLCRQARVTVIQVMGADRLTNSLYSVHARRNDRFLCATSALLELYPRVDFAEIHFTRHLLTTLQAADPARFADVASTLAEAWEDRMSSLIARIRGPVVLLWVSFDTTGRADEMPLGPEPLFITRTLLNKMESDKVQVVQVDAPLFTGAEVPPGMSVSEIEIPMARCLPGPEAHDRIARGLAGPLATLWNAHKKAPHGQTRGA